MTEIWKDIPGFEGFYQVSDAGRVKSLDRVAKDKNGLLKKLKGKIFQPYIGNHGYPVVTLSKDGKKTLLLVHRLVMLAFVGPCPDGKEVAHNDGNRSNPARSNLRYDTRSGNFSDKKSHGTYVAGADVHNAKLTDEQVAEILENVDDLSQQELANKYDVAFQTISNIQRGTTWRHIKLERNSHIKKPARGEHNGSAKLTEAQVRQILSLRGADTITNIAIRFSISQATVSGIYSGRLWRHLSSREIG